MALAFHEFVDRLVKSYGRYLWLGVSRSVQTVVTSLKGSVKFASLKAKLAASAV